MPRRHPGVCACLGATRVCVIDASTPACARRHDGCSNDFKSHPARDDAMATATARRSRARAEKSADADNRARESDTGVTKRAKTTAVTATTGGTDDDGADDVDRAPASNSAYVGVRDADVGELSQRYTQRAEEASGALGNRAEHLSAEERDRLTSEVMRYVLFASHRDQGAPIQRTKI